MHDSGDGEDATGSMSTSAMGEPGEPYLTYRALYERRRSVYVSPPYPLFLEGTIALRSKTSTSGDVALRRPIEDLDSFPLGELFHVELVPVPGDEDYSANEVALEIDGRLVGFLRSGPGARMFDAVVTANRYGYRVLCEGKVFGPPSDLYCASGSQRRLDLRATWGEDLQAWLMLPPVSRGRRYFEVFWYPTNPLTREEHKGHQKILKYLLAEKRSRVLECELTPRPSETGIVDVHIGGSHVGTVSRVRWTASLVSQVQSGERKGLAKLHQWPTEIGLKVMIPEPYDETVHEDCEFVWAPDRTNKREYT
ncbi:hypothetical protein [Rhodococcus zopfii]|uniref:hypothetical protein n=1 Tax=Rhodococcus zopfii TaxID=43772 RepID=UPI0009339A9C|nr:hypothetical protein [Rhodococcus zopfii]